MDEIKVILSEDKRPKHKISMKPFDICLWDNANYKNVSLSKTYWDRKTNSYKSSHLTFLPHEIDIVVKLLDEMIMYIENNK